MHDLCYVDGNLLVVNTEADDIAECSNNHWPVNGMFLVILFVVGAQNIEISVSVCLNVLVLVCLSTCIPYLRNHKYNFAKYSVHFACGCG